MNDFCDLLGTLDGPVSKIVSVKYLVHSNLRIWGFEGKKIGKKLKKIYNS